MHFCKHEEYLVFARTSFLRIDNPRLTTLKEINLKSWCFRYGNTVFQSMFCQISTSGKCVMIKDKHQAFEKWKKEKAKVSGTIEVP